MFIFISVEPFLCNVMIMNGDSINVFSVVNFGYCKMLCLLISVLKIACNKHFNFTVLLCIILFILQHK